MTMTKADIIELVAKRSSIPKKQAELIVNTVFSSIMSALETGDKVELRGFGSFKMKERKSHQARNPKTGDKVFVEAKKIPHFKPGSELKGLING
jgi:integration host factor subunit beta